MEPEELIVVVGATGVLGSEVCRLLAEQGRPVRALVRPTSDPAKVEGLERVGVETVKGDLKDPPALARLCGGATAVVSTASATLSRAAGDSIETVDRDGQLALVDAAERAGVRHFVFVSFAEMEPDSPLQAAKRAVEERLRRSAMTYTILHPANFMEIWLGPAAGFDAETGRVRIVGSGESPVSWISYRDVARFAVEALENPAARNAVLALGGPEALSPLEVVRIFEEESGRAFAVEHVPEDALREQQAAAEDSLQASFAALMLGTARGQAVDMTETLRAFPVELTSVRDYARTVVSGQK